jgi:hypothetical protein
MENLSEQEKAEMLDNCRKATLLIEKQLTDGITPKEKSALEYHLTICKMCNTFLQQSGVVNQMVKKLSHPGENELKLAEGFKEQLQKQIDAKLDQSSNK